MKFNCGMSPEAKAAKKQLEFKKRIESRIEWNRWFAWRPVRVGEEDCRWLEYVERRLKPVYDYSFSRRKLDHHDTWWYKEWEYRAIND